jgi:hypothetical protein
MLRLAPTEKAGCSFLNGNTTEWGDDITDAGLVHLYGLNKLKWLDIGFCHSLTNQGIAKLKENLPECEIIAERLL